MATMADKAMLVMISSVYRRSGVFYDRWSKFYGVNDANVLVIQGSSLQFNPTLDSGVVADAMADDATVAQAEYESRWRDDLAGYLTLDQIMTVVDRGISTRSPQHGVRYEAWVDASSGQGRDSMCAAIGHRDANGVAIIDHIVEIKPPFRPSDAVAQIAGILKSYGINRCVGDKWALGFVANEFERNGITLNHADKPGSELYRQCLPIITSMRCRLLDHPRMISQFSNLERRALPGGNERIDHPRGQHDDVSMVTAGCLVALAQELRGAEAWIEYLRRQNEAAGLSFNRMNVDLDGARAPGPEFGWNLRNDSEPLFRLWWPELLVRGTPDIRFEEGRPCKSCTRAEAQSYLRQPAIRQLNEALASELEESKWPR
jgi:hypothetical protein